MLDWSYDLLPEFERSIFHELSAFVGAFSLEAAQCVVADDALAREQIAEAIARLVMKSLIEVETNQTGTLYRLLDTTRTYMVAKIVESGDRKAIWRRQVIDCCGYDRVDIAALVSAT
jgi:predicted ATPase